MELTSAVRSVSSSNKCNGMITAARKNQADALNPHPPHGESFFLSPFSKLSLKIGTANAICWNSLGLFSKLWVAKSNSHTRDFIFFRNKIFQDRKLTLSASVLIKKNFEKSQLIQLIETIFISIFCIRCLIELKFCEVSQNSFSNWWCMFQLSNLKNKKVYS